MAEKNPKANKDAPKAQVLSSLILCQLTSCLGVCALTLKSNGPLKLTRLVLLIQAKMACSYQHMCCVLLGQANGQLQQVLSYAAVPVVRPANTFCSTTVGIVTEFDQICICVTSRTVNREGRPAQEQRLLIEKQFKCWDQCLHHNHASLLFANLLSHLRFVTSRQFWPWPLYFCCNHAASLRVY